MTIDRDWLARNRESALEPGLAIIDAHHHLWDRPAFRYLFEDLIEDASAILGRVLCEGLGELLDLLRLHLRRDRRHVRINNRLDYVWLVRGEGRLPRARFDPLWLLLIGCTSRPLNHSGCWMACARHGPAPPWLVAVGSSTTSSSPMRRASANWRA